VFQSYAEFLFAEVVLLQGLILEVFNIVRIHIVLVVRIRDQVLLQILIDGDNDVLLQILEESFDEGGPDLTDATLEPHIVVQKVTLACEDSQVYREVVVVASHYWDQTFLHFLSDVQHAREVHYSVVVLV
jgi:hypothetical protein